MIDILKKMRREHPEIAEAEKLDKKFRHVPTKLYCLGCGYMINDKFTGGAWSYTHPCKMDYDKIDNRSMSTAFGTLKFGIMYPTSLVLHPFKFKKCNKCDTKEEHIEMEIKKYLGRHFQDFKITDKKVLDLRKEFINYIIKQVKE